MEQTTEQPRVEIRHRGERKTVAESDWQTTLDDMVTRLGPWDPPGSSVRRIDPAAVQAVHDELGTQLPRLYHEPGTQILRQDAAHRTLERRRERHAHAQPLVTAAAELIDTVKAERRRDIPVTAGELARQLTCNGLLRVGGYQLREHALRGLMSRLGSPALGYLLGMRDRMASNGDPGHRDREHLLATVQHELKQADSTPLVLRTRDEHRDVYAVVSPGYGVADAPDVIPALLADLPDDARGTTAYDPSTTAWEIRMSLYTPKPSETVAIGEPFEGFASWASRDAGNGRLRRNGGIVVVSCLNAACMPIDLNVQGFVHRRGIRDRVSAAIPEAMRAMHRVAQVWGLARTDRIPHPTTPAGDLIPLEHVIPGFFRAMLTARRGEYAHIMAGRTEEHVRALSVTYEHERRNHVEHTRGDLAQAWTRYAQDHDLATQGRLEQATGQWLLSGAPVDHVAR